MKRTRFKNPRAKTGPKAFYYQGMIQQVFELSRFGMLNDEIAEFYGISPCTFGGYLKTKPGLNEALQEGRLISSLGIVDSLYKQACGYDVIEREEEYAVTKEGVKILMKQKVNHKHIVANVTAAIYLLKTRHGDKWSDFVKIEHSGNIGIQMKKLQMQDMSTEELLMLEKIGMKQLMDVKSN